METLVGRISQEEIYNFFLFGENKIKLSCWEKGRRRILVSTHTRKWEMEMFDLTIFVLWGGDHVRQNQNRRHQSPCSVILIPAPPLPLPLPPLSIIPSIRQYIYIYINFRAVLCGGEKERDCRSTRSTVRT